MNKKSFKIFTILFLIIISIYKVSAISIDEYINEETNYKVIIEDDANLLSEAEIYNLKEDMMVLTEYGNVAFKTINENSYSTSTYASNYYHKIFGTESGTLFLIDMDNRYIYIFSDGYNYKIITTSKANIITDNVYKYASNQQYYECASKAFEQVGTLLEGGKIAEPMRYISNILIAFTIAFFINFVIVLFNTKIKKAHNKEIVSNCNVAFDVKNVHVIKTGTHRVYSPRSDSSSSGGGFSGGSSSSGGSSGGGGGHRF